jgi:hypothetical protein
MENKEDTLLTVVAIYLCLSSFPFLFGLLDARSLLNNNCDRALSRIEYLFPAHALGCWLGSTPGVHK